MLGQSDVYVVKKVLWSRIKKGKRYIPIKWSAWTTKYDTWELQENLIRKLVETYIAERPS